MKIKTYKDIQKSLSDLDGKHIENNLLNSLDVSLTAHFGNSVTCEMQFENCCLFASYNLGGLTADVLKAIIECLKLSEEDGLRISEVKNIPVRIVCDSKWGKVIGFGHFMEDRFLLADDIIAMAKENMELRYIRKEREQNG